MSRTPPNVATGQGSIAPATKPKKPAAPKPPSAAPGKGRYQWATGGKVHNISLAQHNQDVNVQRTLGTNDLTAPPTGAQAIKEANASADMQFAPQIQAAQQLQTNLPGWYADYLARVAGYATAAKTMAAPVIAQSTAFQNNTATQLPPGIDPNSVAGQQAIQAAQGRAALAQAGTDALNANAQATQDYFGGQQQIAAKELPQAQTAAGQQLASAQSQRGAAVSNYLTTARTQAQNYAIARGTLGLNTAKAKSDATAASDAAKAKVTADDNKMIISGPFAGLTNAEVRALDPTTLASMRAAAKTPAAAEKPYSSGAFAGMKPSELARHSRSWIQGQIDTYNSGKGQRSSDAAAEKALEGRRTSSNKEASRVTDITDRVGTYAARPIRTGTTTRNADGSTTEQTRPATPEDVTNMLLKDGFSAEEIKLALKVRSGQPLTQSDILLAHRMGLAHIPNAWLHPPAKPPKSKVKVGSSLTNPLTGQANPIVPGG